MYSSRSTLPHSRIFFLFSHTSTCLARSCLESVNLFCNLSGLKKFFWTVFGRGRGNISHALLCEMEASQGVLKEIQDF